MPVYDKFPAVDADYKFPPEVTNAISKSPEVAGAIKASSDQVIADVSSAFGVLAGSVTGIERKVGDLAVNVKDFGAIGDGVADDTSAVQNAVDHIDSMRGGTLWFPDGQFKINGNVYLCSNIHITGTAGAVIRKTTGASNYCVFVGLSGGNLGYGGGLHNIKLTGLTFRGDLNAGKSLSAMSLHRASGVYARDCKFLETSQNGHVFDLMGCDWVYIENSEFRGVKPVTGRGYTEAIQIDSSTANGLGFDLVDRAADEIFDGTATRNVFVTGCTFGGITVNGTYYQGQSPIGSHSYIDGFAYTNINFVNNDVEGVQSSVGDNYTGVIHFIGAQDVTIKDNRLDGSSIPNAAIRFHAGTLATRFADVNNGSSSVTTALNPTHPKNIVVANNKVRNFTGSNTVWIYGVSGYQLQNIQITDNEFSNCLVDATTGYILQTTWIQNLLVRGNILVNCGYGGFYGADATSVIYKDNVSNTSGHFPLALSRIQQADIIGNQFLSGIREVSLAGIDTLGFINNRIETSLRNHGIVITAPITGFKYIQIVSNAVTSTDASLVTVNPAININSGYNKGLVSNNVAKNYQAPVATVSGLTTNNNIAI